MEEGKSCIVIKTGLPVVSRILKYRGKKQKLSVRKILEFLKHQTLCGPPTGDYSWEESMV